MVKIGVTWAFDFDATIVDFMSDMKRVIYNRYGVTLHGLPETWDCVAWLKRHGLNFERPTIKKIIREAQSSLGYQTLLTWSGLTIIDYMVHAPSLTHVIITNRKDIEIVKWWLKKRGIKALVFSSHSTPKHHYLQAFGIIGGNLPKGLVDDNADVLLETQRAGFGVIGIKCPWNVNKITGKVPMAIDQKSLRMMLNGFI